MILLATFYDLSYVSRSPPPFPLKTFLHKFPGATPRCYNPLFLSQNLLSMLSFSFKSEAKAGVKGWCGEKSAKNDPHPQVLSKSGVETKKKKKTPPTSRNEH